MIKISTMKIVRSPIFPTINLSARRKSPLATIIAMNTPLIITAIPSRFNSLINRNVAQTITIGFTIKNGVIFIFFICQSAVPSYNGCACDVAG